MSASNSTINVIRGFVLAIWIVYEGYDITNVKIIILSIVAIFISEYFLVPAIKAFSKGLFAGKLSTELKRLRKILKG